MHAADVIASRRSVRAGLDALVLEEIEALGASLPPLRHPAPAPVRIFASDEEFLLAALRYLAAHADPGALVARLSAGFEAGPTPPAATDEEASGPDAAGPSNGWLPRAAAQITPLGRSPEGRARRRGGTRLSGGLEGGTLALTFGRRPCILDVVW